MQSVKVVLTSLDARTRGFTLIELLIASAIMVGILSIIAQSFRVGGQEVARSFAVTDMSEDTRLAGQLMADEVARAVYVYPPGAVITLGGGYTTEKPSVVYRSDGTTVAATLPRSQWTVGTDPILAMLVPPMTVGTCNSTNESNCLYFVAYYPVERSGVVAGATGANNENNPGADPLNSSNWVLYELRNRLDSATLATGTAAGYDLPALTYTGSGIRGYILADHIDAGGFKINFGAATDTFCRNKDGSPVDCNTSPGLSLNALATVIRGNFSLQSAIARGNLPGKVKSQRYDYAIGPRNLYPKL